MGGRRETTASDSREHGRPRLVTAALSLPRFAAGARRASRERLSEDHRRPSIPASAQRGKRIAEDDGGSALKTWRAVACAVTPPGTRQADRPAEAPNSHWAGHGRGRGGGQLWMSPRYR